MNLDRAILSLILITPLAGALLLALLPDREGSKLQAAGALVVTLSHFCSDAASAVPLQLRNTAGQLSIQC